MKVAFDAKRAFFNNSGLGNYSRGVIECLNTFHPQLELHLFSPNGKNQISGKFSVQNTNHFFNGFLKKWKRIQRSSAIAQKLDIDLFHGLSNELPTRLHEKKIKSVVTIHDLIFLKLPEYYKALDRNIYLAKTKYAVKNADLIITTSEQTKHDLDELFGVGEKCRTIYQHVSQFEQASFGKSTIAPYLIYISSFERRKNHKILLTAFNSIISKTDINLVLMGRPRETFEECKNYVQEQGLEKRVTFIPNASSAQIQNYLAQSNGFVYPSLYEGFGIPLLEAMQLGVPLACSNIPVFNEIAVSNTLFFDPNSIHEIAQTLLSLAKNHNENRIVDKEHLRKFSAETHANALNESYKNLL